MCVAVEALVLVFHTYQCGNVAHALTTTPSGITTVTIITQVCLVPFVILPWIQQVCAHI